MLTIFGAFIRLSVVVTFNCNSLSTIRITSLLFSGPWTIVECIRFYYINLITEVSPQRQWFWAAVLLSTVFSWEVNRLIVVIFVYHFPTQVHTIYPTPWICTLQICFMPAIFTQVLGLKSCVRNLILRKDLLVDWKRHAFLFLGIFWNVISKNIDEAILTTTGVDLLK